MEKTIVFLSLALFVGIVLFGFSRYEVELLNDDLYRQRIHNKNDDDMIHSLNSTIKKKDSMIELTNDFLSEPILTILQQGDFQLELKSARQYLASEMNVINAKFIYKGSNEVTIWSCPSYHSFAIEDSDGNLVYAEEQLFVETMHILEPNYRKEFKLNLHELNLSQGEYIIVSYVLFHLEERPDENIKFSVQVPFKVT
ncbi:hypothetical protein RJG79_05295 [Mycoplasmatota bacterium WC44]